MIARFALQGGRALQRAGEWCYTPLWLVALAVLIAFWQWHPAMLLGFWAVLVPGFRQRVWAATWTLAGLALMLQLGAPVWWLGWWLVPLCLLVPGWQYRQLPAELAREWAWGSAGVAMLWVGAAGCWLLLGSVLAVAGISWAMIALAQARPAGAQRERPLPRVAVELRLPLWLRVLLLGSVLAPVPLFLPHSGIGPAWWLLLPLALSTLCLHPLRLLLLAGVAAAGPAWVWFVAGPGVMAEPVVALLTAGFGVALAEHQQRVSAPRYLPLLGLAILWWWLAPQLVVMSAAGYAIRSLLLPVVPPALPPSTAPLAAARRAAWRLPTFWACMSLGKYAGDPVYRRLLSDDRPWGRVLDMGCGHGLLAALARTRPGTTGYHGVDLDAHKLTIAQRFTDLLPSTVHVVWHSLLFPRQGLSDNPQFDSIFVLDVLHYWPRDQQLAVLAALREHARPGARLILREGLRDADQGMGAVGLGEAWTTAVGLNPGDQGLHFLSPGELDQLLLASDWRVLSREPCGDHNQLWHAEAQDQP